MSPPYNRIKLHIEYIVEATNIILRDVTHIKRQIWYKSKALLFNLTAASRKFKALFPHWENTVQSCPFFRYTSKSKALFTLGSKIRPEWSKKKVTAPPRCIEDVFELITQTTFRGGLSHFWPHCFSSVYAHNSTDVCETRSNNNRVYYTPSDFHVVCCNLYHGLDEYLILIGWKLWMDFQYTAPLEFLK